jgi:uncharacterized membrane protein YphA (DoxX/SURF4 family)
MSRTAIVPSRALPWLSAFARWVLAAVLLYAGWPKLLDAAGTVRSVRNFRLLPEALVPPVGYGLPVLELLLGLALLAGLATRLAAVVTAALMVAFIVGIAAAWARGLAIECGCFGAVGTFVSDPVPGYVRDIMRDVGYLALALWLAIRPGSRLSLDTRLAGPTRIPSQPETLSEDMR